MSDPDETFQDAKTAVTAVGGDVYMSLPGDMFIQLTPERARRIGTALFFKANEAEGLEPPEVVVFTK